MAARVGAGVEHPHPMGPGPVGTEMLQPHHRLPAVPRATLGGRGGVRQDQTLSLVTLVPQKEALGPKKKVLVPQIEALGSQKSLGTGSSCPCPAQPAI